MDFASFRNSIRTRYGRYVTPPTLLKEGFHKVGKRYNKSFSKVVELNVAVTKANRVSLSWTFNEGDFKQMLGKLRAIKGYLKAKAEEVYASHTLPKVSERRALIITLSIIDEEYAAESRRIDAMRTEFEQKYKDFLDPFWDPKYNDTKLVAPDYEQIYLYFFEAAKKPREVRLCQEFVDVFWYVSFGRGRKAKRAPRISAERIKEAMAAYYVLLFTITKVRNLYEREDVPLSELEGRFPMLDKDFLETITLDRAVIDRDMKGWAYSASEIALDFAAFLCGTTPANFRQIKMREKVCAGIIKEHIRGLGDVEEYLEEDTVPPVPPDLYLEREKAGEDVWLASIEYALSNRCRTLRLLETRGS